MADVLAAAPKGGAQAANVANLTGTMLVQQGRIAEGLAAMRSIKRLAPRSPTLQMSRVMYLNYDPDLSRADLFREHRAFGTAFRDAAAPLPPPDAGPRDPQRRLRIGYLSPDFRTHSVAYFVAPVFQRSTARASRPSAMRTSRSPTTSPTTCAAWRARGATSARSTMPTSRA